MKKHDKQDVITPVESSHSDGTKFSKDNYQTRPKLKCRYTLCMPDGMLFSVPIYEGENDKSRLGAFIHNWYKVTTKDPKKFGHIVLKKKCPKCGGELHAKDLDHGRAIWCVNHTRCDYEQFKEKKKTSTDKVEEMLERLDLDAKYVEKSGTSSTTFNKIGKA